MDYGNMTTDQLQVMAANQAYGYGDQQAMLTNARAAYGDHAAQLMMGGMVMAGGISSGVGRMYSDLGRMIQPVGYTAPAHVETGFYGQVSMQQGFFGSMYQASGIGSPPFGGSRYQQMIHSSSDFSERLVGGGAHAAATVGGIAVGGALSPGMGALGGSMLGKVGKFAGGMFGGYAVGMMAADALMGSVQSHRDIQNYLESSSFRFVGSGSSMADPRTGSGMSRGARQETAEFIRGMDIADPTLNTEELTSILKQSDQMGLFVGSGGDIETFKQKFKEITENVKLVAKTLNQTLEQGINTIKELRGIGIEGNEVAQAVQFSQMGGMAAGRTPSEMLGLGLQGAEMFRGTGVSMGIGFRGAQMNLTSVRAARDAQMLSQESIAQAGGEEALAMRMTSSGLQFAQSAFGRGFGATFFDPSTGGFSAGGFNNLINRGGGDFMGNYMNAANNLMDPKSIIKYQARQEEFFSDMGKQFGGIGMQMFQNLAAVNQAGMLTQHIPGLGMEDAFRYSLKQQGVSEPEIQARLAQLKTAQESFSANQRASAQARDERIVENSYQNNSVNRAIDSAQDAVKGAINPAVQSVNRAMNNAVRGTEEFIEEQFYGVQRGNFSDIDYSALSLGGGGASTRSSAVNLDRGGSLSRTSGEALLSTAMSGLLGSEGRAAVRGLTAGATAPANAVILSERAVVNGDDYTTNFHLTGTALGGKEQMLVMSAKDVSKFSGEAVRIHNAVVNANDMAKKGQLKGVQVGMRNRFEGALVGGDIREGMSLQDIAVAVTGKELSELSAQEIAALTMESQSIPSAKAAVESARESLSGASGVESAMSVDAMRDLRGRFEVARTGLAEMVGVSELGPGVAENLAVAIRMGQRGDAAGGQRRMAQAIRLQTNFDPSSNASDIAAQFRAAKYSPDLDPLVQTGVEMAQFQARRGTNAIVQAMKIGLADEQGASLSDTNRNRALNLANMFTEGGAGALLGERAEAMAGMASGDISFLKETVGGAGALLGERAEALKDIKGLGRGDRSGLVDILKSQGITDRAKVSSIIDRFDKGGADAAMKKAYSVFMGSLASDTVAASAGGSGGVGTETGTPEAEYARQTQMNAATLHAMEALARRLGFTQ